MSPAEAASCSGVAAWDGVAPCTTYAVGALVTYNGSRYHALTGHCNETWGPPPNVPTIWAADGACDSSTAPPPTATPTATSTPTPTYATSTPPPSATPTTATATPTTATARPTATATTPTATPTTGGSTSCWAPWVQQDYPQGSRVSKNGYNYEAYYWTNTDPSLPGNSGVAGSGVPWVNKCGCGAPTPVPTPAPSGFGSIVSEAQFKNLFVNCPIHAAYKYSDLVTAANSHFPAFAGTGDVNVKRREAAAAFANWQHESFSGNKAEEDNKGDYCDVQFFCAYNGNINCAAGKKYYGRHAIQLSWNYNYCRASEYLNVNLHANPDQVLSNPVTGWRLSIWYWMTQAGPAKPGWPQVSAHTAITTTDSSGNYGFGATIRAINGVLECQGGSVQAQKRIDNYTGGDGSENGSGGTLGVVGYGGGAFGRLTCN